MQRRQFIVHTGTLLSATMVAQCGMIPEETGNDKPSKRRPHPDDFTTPALKAIALGMNAPNPHNTQAWKFKIISDDEFIMYVDETRLLPATDPPARQIHIGCGCFLSVMQTGLTAHGYKVSINLLPEGEYTYAEIGHKPVAHVSVLRDENNITDDLADAIYTRRTNRLVYSNERISPADLNAILAEAPPQQSTIRFITGDKAVAHLDILYQGMVIESKTYRTYEESRIWFRENDKRIAEKRDGINLPAGGTIGIKKFFAEMILKGLDPKDWHKESTISQHLSAYEQKVKSANAIVQIMTKTNTPIDWLKAGMDYARFQLAATKKNYYLHPLSQALQEFPEMDGLRNQYDRLNGITGDEKIQLVVRIGKAKEPFESYRRNVNELLI